MKKQYEKTVVQKFEDTYCDKCGEKVEVAHDDAFRFRFEHVTGTNYGNDADGNRSDLDLCPTCAPKAVEVLKQNGFNVQETSWMI